MTGLHDLVVGFWPFWYPVAAAAGLFVGSWMSRRWKRRVARARRLLDREIAASGRPSPAPIDVELMR